MAAPSPSASRSIAEVEPLVGPYTWRVVLEYDGARFSGWQHQAQGLCIQDCVEEALGRVFDAPVGRVVASGRTDAGVHALGQVCSFRTERERSARAVRDGLNAVLPPDIACLEAALAAPEFHAQRSAVGKLYRYRLLLGPTRSALRRARVWPVRWALGADAMQQAAEVLVGTHDFSSFRAAGCSALSPVRTLSKARVELTDDELHVELYGDGFLRHMVRNIVGSLVEVGRGRRDPAWFAEVLARADRRQAGPTAPPDGLYLVRVDYPAELLRAQPATATPD